MARQPMNETISKFAKALSNPAILFIVILIASFMVISVLQVNSYDNTIHRRASFNVLFLHRFPFDDPIEQRVTLYFHPTHTAILTAAFVLFREKIAAWWNFVFIIIVLIGFRRGRPAYTTLLFLLSPPLIFVAAAANMPGFTTALGLIFVLANKRGALRGYSWAMMFGRPQDNVFGLLFDFARALKQRDWIAFLIAGLLTLPTWITLQHWLTIIPRNDTDLRWRIEGYYTLSASINSGMVVAVLFVLLILVYRLIIIDLTTKPTLKVSFRRRQRIEVSLTEWMWLGNLAWLMFTPYYLMYMVWMMLLPLRLYSAKRTLICWVGVMLIGIQYMHSLTYHFDDVYIGGLILVLWIAVLTPKKRVEISEEYNVLPA